MSRKVDFYLPFPNASMADVHAHLVELGNGSQYAIDGDEIIERRSNGEKIRWQITYNGTDAGKFTHVFLSGEDIED